MGNNTDINQALNEQYKTSENLNIRGNLHSYNTNKTDWNNWCFNQMQIPDGARILELGCGTGELWYKNSNLLNKNWEITLSDFSAGMLQSTMDKLQQLDYSFKYKVVDAQNIPYEDECFDVVIARHMLYLVPEIEKAISEVKRVLGNGGTFYVTTNSRDAMSELNKLVESFDTEMGLHNNGMCERFDMEDGYLLLKKYFSQVKTDVLQGSIVVDEAEPIAAYKASTIKGRSVLVGEKRQQFKRYLEDYIKKNGKVSITTKSCMFSAKK